MSCFLSQHAKHAYILQRTRIVFLIETFFVTVLASAGHACMCVVNACKNHIF